MDIIKKLPLNYKARGLKNSADTVSQYILSVLPEDPACCPPLIFMHGFCGFKDIDIMGIKVIQYWQRIAHFFEQRGYKTFIPEVSPFNPSQVRATEWQVAIEDYRQQHNAEKVILIAHSQGAIDARLLVCPRTDPIKTRIGRLSGKAYGKHVDKLISLGGPHFGNASVDLLDRNSRMQKVMKEILDLADIVSSGLMRKQQDAVTAIESLSQEYMLAEFNPYCIDAPDVDYYCLAGNPVNNTPKIPMLSHSFYHLLAIKPQLGGGENDGLVTVASALFGNDHESTSKEYCVPEGAKVNDKWKVLGIVDMDHIAMIGLPIDIYSKKQYQQIKSVLASMPFKRMTLAKAERAGAGSNGQRILQALQISAPTFNKKEAGISRRA